MIHQNSKIYFDNNSSTAIAPEVLEAMNEVSKLPLNSSAIHHFGRMANNFINTAKQKISQLLNADSYEIMFTATATEATNTAFFGNNFAEILIPQIEHLSVYNCRPKNCQITEILATENCQIDIDDFQKKIPSHKNFLASLMLANNETGVIQPAEEISQLTHQNFGLYHCDAVQAIGKIAIDLEKINADFISITAHKINGPQGVGALLYRKGLDFNPLILGGKQQKSKRGGSLNIAGVVGFGVACELAQKRLDNFAKIKNLTKYLEDNLKKIAGNDIMIFGENQPRLANTCMFSLKNSDNQTQLINFDLNNIAVSAGSACSSGSINNSRILLAMKVPPEFLQGSIRVSLSTNNTQEEIDYFLQIFSQFYQRTKINGVFK
jgi:cysteine desulfurase